MQTIRFYSQADENGKLQLQLDHLPVNKNLEIVVVYQPVSSHITAPSNQDEDPILGLFSDDSKLAEDSKEIAEMNEEELKIELALLLYKQNKISSGKVRDWLGLTVLEFQHELAKRELAINYDLEELNQDVETLKSLGLL